MDIKDIDQIFGFKKKNNWLKKNKVERKKINDFTIRG
jgi:hypothetical protein